MVEEWHIFFKKTEQNLSINTNKTLNKMYIEQNNTCPAKQQTETHCTET